MDLCDVVQRAELHAEFARRFAEPGNGAGRPKLEARLAGAWSLTEMAMRTYSTSQPDVLIRAAVNGYRSYSSSVSSKLTGFLFYLFRELSPREQWNDVITLPSQTEWAARLLECVRAGLGDEEFGRLVVGVSEILAELAEDAQPAGVS
ncbi:hypothetical protein [Streptomyces californicus]|uniref:hypothetical protein n=1 Tax=Streptomyces californicus TaxID=67351 RepID=UPI0033E279C3